MKKIYEYIGLMGLICFSFFYTSNISLVIKENDDILKQIKKVEAKYRIDAINAKIDGDTIIPGVNGSIIDIDETYKKMKKINNFNPNLLVYKEIEPEISIDKKYDKYIISGNRKKKQVSLIFKIETNDNIDNIIAILDKYGVKANFFVNDNWLNDKQEKVNILKQNNHIVEPINPNGKQKYCMELDKNVIDECSKNKSYTIKPNLIIKNNPLIEIKKNLNNGSIILLDINKTKELSLIIQYINSKDIKIVNLKSLIEE